MGQIQNGQLVKAIEVGAEQVADCVVSNEESAQALLVFEGVQGDVRDGVVTQVQFEQVVKPVERVPGKWH